MWEKTFPELAERFQQFDENDRSENLMEPEGEGPTVVVKGDHITDIVEQNLNDG